MKKPNVIVFFTDQQRHDTTGVHGNPLELTPNFDVFARQGTHCFNAFTPQPVCGPARACLQTGKYATTNGCFRNAIALNPADKTMAHYFKDAGYDTAYIGKWHLADPECIGPVPEAQRGGYESWLAANVLEHVSDAYDLHLFDEEGKDNHLPGYRVDAQTDAAIRYVNEHQENPFFLFMSFLEPHHQNHIDDYPPPDGYRERYTGRYTPPDLAALGGSSAQHLGGYYGMVKRLDEAFGRLIDALKSMNLLDDTIIVFTSDHGCHFKTRNAEYKRSCHDSSLRVPMAFNGPGFKAGGEQQQLVSLLDIAPTLLDAAGIPVPDDMQGNSLLPLINKTRHDWPDDMFAQISESQVARVIRTHRWKYCVTALDADPWDDMTADTYTETHLYDLHSDPHELSNLIGLESHREVAAVMRERLLKRMSEAGERTPAITLAPAVTGFSQRSVRLEETLE